MLANAILDCSNQCQSGLLIQFGVCIHGHVIIILGGLGTLAGPLIGAVAFLLLEETLPELLHAIAPNYAENWMIIFGPILIAIVLFARGGLMGLLQRFNRGKR